MKRRISIAAVVITAIIALTFMFYPAEVDQNGDASSSTAEQID